MARGIHDDPRHNDETPFPWLRYFFPKVSHGIWGTHGRHACVHGHVHFNVSHPHLTGL